MPDPIKDFLGSGWSFPPRLDARGRIALAHQEQDVLEAIRIILRTQPGERPMLPTFGSELYRLAFAPNDATTAGLARRYVLEALTRWEPRIEVLDVAAAPSPLDPAQLHLQVCYRLIATQTDHNLIFPFYLLPGEE